MREGPGSDDLTRPVPHLLMVAASPPVARLSDGTGPRGCIADRAFRAVILLAGFSVLVILGLIAFSTTHEAWPGSRRRARLLHLEDLGRPGRHFGALAFIYGTLVVSAIALVIAVPVSIGIALFITEVAPVRLRTPDRLRDRPARRGPVGGVRALGRRSCSRRRRRLLPTIPRTRSSRIPVLGTLVLAASR